MNRMSLMMLFVVSIYILATSVSGARSESGRTRCIHFRSGEVALNLNTRAPIKNTVVGSRDTAKYLAKLLVPAVQLTHCG